MSSATHHEPQRSPDRHPRRAGLLHRPGPRPRKQAVRLDGPALLRGPLRRPGPDPVVVRNHPTHPARGAQRNRHPPVPGRAVAARRADEPVPRRVPVRRPRSGNRWRLPRVCPHREDQPRCDQGRSQDRDGSRRHRHRQHPGRVRSEPRRRAGRPSHINPHLHDRACAEPEVVAGRHRANLSPRTTTAPALPGEQEKPAPR